jgi:hypothetical protein
VGIILVLAGLLVLVYLLHLSQNPLPGLRDFAVVVRAAAEVVRAACRR